MRILTYFLFSLLPLSAQEAAQEASPEKKTFAQPALIETDELKEFSTLSPERQALIEAALKGAKAGLDKKYLFGGESPDVGFDCSGAIYYTLEACGYDAPRSSAAQFIWLREVGNIIEIPEKTTKLDDPIFEKLSPGDLVFWSGTYIPTDDRKVKITHVGIYLGTEKKDGRPVMACSTEGRSYRGTQASGFGVYDFKLPSPKSRSKLVAYGAIPKLPKKIKPSAEK